jgi:hypothetical protein
MPVGIGICLCGRYFVGLPRAIIEFSIGKREPLFLRYIGVTDEWWRLECCDCIDGYFWLTILISDMICEFKYILHYVNDRKCVGLFEVSELMCLWREKIALMRLMNLVYVVYDIICCCFSCLVMIVVYVCVFFWGMLRLWWSLIFWLHAWGLEKSFEENH